MEGAQPIKPDHHSGRWQTAYTPCWIRVHNSWLPGVVLIWIETEPNRWACFVEYPQVWGTSIGVDRGYFAYDERFIRPVVERPPAD